MAKYVYPAIFTPEDVGGYSIRFPDVEGCYTQGEDLADGIIMANDALCMMLYGMEDDGKPLPPATALNNVAHEAEEIVTLIACDTLEYRKLFDNKAVKKTLTIPNWLNTLAERNGVNFSGVLQEALKQKLNIG
jgi:predicted RNase H-like HicB family nuclease